jgi:hypothetical protein
MKHTKGPWILNYPHPSSNNFIIGNDTFEDFVMNPIAEILPPVCESEAQQLDEQEANAKLIAAAPELFESLSELLALLDEHEPEWYLRGHYNRAIKAINKATK